MAIIVKKSCKCLVWAKVACDEDDSRDTAYRAALS